MSLISAGSISLDSTFKAWDCINDQFCSTFRQHSWKEIQQILILLYSSLCCSISSQKTLNPSMNFHFQRHEGEAFSIKMFNSFGGKRAASLIFLSIFVCIIITVIAKCHLTYLNWIMFIWYTLQYRDSPLPMKRSKHQNCIFLFCFCIWCDSAVRNRSALLCRGSLQCLRISSSRLLCEESPLGPGRDTNRGPSLRHAGALPQDLRHIPVSFATPLSYATPK